MTPGKDKFMRRMGFNLGCGAALLLVLGGWVRADHYGLTAGKLELKSANVLAFGPHGILFVGDAQAAKIYAVQSGDPLAVKQNLDDAAGVI